MSSPTRSQQQIALGTAQIGLDYGITNTSGRVADKDIPEMLATAWRGGIRILDTAAAYGSSEGNLGPHLASEPDRRWQIVTKTRPLHRDTVRAPDIANVAEGFEHSLARLKVHAVDALLVHHAQDLLVPGGAALYDWLIQTRASGKARRIGVSIYTAQEAQSLLHDYSFDIVQLPASIADQRLIRDGTVAQLVRNGVEVHARSLYLQGLLLAEPEFVAARFPSHAAWMRAFRTECMGLGLQPAQACMSFFRSQSDLQVAVVGATRQQDIVDLLTAWQASRAMDWSGWAVEDPEFTDPRQWNKA